MQSFNFPLQYYSLIAIRDAFSIAKVVKHQTNFVMKKN